ncbi:hypothetical protein [Breoghania sp. L-A4]|uniref:hypothetical protein n=1 Tax=Breoghania sp. L-A4 TaxID=2304600 RepID=UPI000E358674|nr:hypothetical protein [Breoghania sp. L-A4]AXS41585.1 hypothetical protein D1F64_18220 [Breoghania sp. L-A4]
MTPVPPIETVDETVARMIDVADRLLALAHDENRRLAAGMTMPLDDIVAQKHELAEQFSRWMRQIKTQQLLLIQASPELATQLLERGRRLGQALSENAAELNKAMAASQRRVDAIMRVVREESKPPPVYGVNGRYASPVVNRTVSLHPGCKA